MFIQDISVLDGFIEFETSIYYPWTLTMRGFTSDFSDLVGADVQFVEISSNCNCEGTSKMFKRDSYHFYDPILNF